MDLFDLVAKITLDSSEYEKGIKGAEEGTSALSSKWSAFGKVAGVAGAAAIAAIRCTGCNRLITVQKSIPGPPKGGPYFVLKVFTVFFS